MSSVLEQQALAVKILSSHIRQEHLSSSYLVTGNDPDTRKDLARMWACALNCQDHRAFEDCACPSCRKIKSGVHPDVQWLGSNPEARSIKIEEVRQMKNWVYLKPYEGRWKVFAIQDAERLTVEAQNTLLKILEEPPRATVFCLLVENKFNLLETVLSRCYEVRLRPGARSESSLAPAAVLPPGWNEKSWEDFLELYQGKNREEIRTVFDALLAHFHARLQATAADDLAQGAAWVEAIERLCETKEALEDNANQKLALTRLTLHLRRVLPASVLRNS